MSSVSQQDAERPVYPAWIRSRRVVVFWLVAAAVIVLGAVVALFWLPGPAFALLAIPVLYLAIVLTWTSYRLGPRGGDVQSRIHLLWINSVGNDGWLLDVGRGSGHLLIQFAKSAPGDYVGLDYWSDDWEYSRSQAERNAALDGVQGLQFPHGSASRLPFASQDFGRLVSCLTFHEARDVADKAVSVAEALRALKPGGRFAFIGLCDDPKLYNGRGRVLNVIASDAGEGESSRNLSELLELHFPLTLAQVLKHTVLISGSKTPVIGQRDMPPEQ
jgi:SAM-dependent methyltransferase